MMQRTTRDVQVAGRGARARASTGVSPACEGLDGRRLLSTVAAASAAIPTPPAAAVANAAADLDAIDPTTFAQLQADLASAEGRSHVTEAQADKLAQDEDALQQMIASADLHPTTSLGTLDLQDVVAGAFRESPAEVAQDRAPLDEYVAKVPGGARLVDRTIEQMQAVSRATDATPQTRAALSSDWQFLAFDLGPSPDYDLGSGEASGDPLEVYYDGQVDDFIKS